MGFVQVENGGDRTDFSSSGHLKRRTSLLQVMSG